MKLKVFFVLIASAAVSSLMGGSAVTTEIAKAVLYQPEKYSFGKNIIISSALNKYSFTAKRSRVINDTPPRTSFTMNTQLFGFSSLINFLSITVNDIHYSKIPINDNDFTSWRNQDASGAEIKMNFDGAKVLLRFYMQPDSGVFWGELIPDENSPEPVKNVKVNFSCLPSWLAKQDGKPIFHNVYSHEARTPATTYRQSTQIQPISPDDKYFILYDTNFDGSTPEKGYGPCMIIIDSEKIQSGSLRMHNAWTVDLLLDLKPNFEKFKFGLWQSNARISNSEFFSKLEKEKESFLPR